MPQRFRWSVRRPGLGTPPAIRRWRRPITRCASRRCHSNWLPAKRSRPPAITAKFRARCCGFAKEARSTIKVINDAGYPDIVHWHGLYLPAVQDGATEEGSPIIPVGQSHLYSFTPKPAGTRWYHSHAMAMTDLTRSTYSGEFGFLIVEPAAGDPGRYDREVLLAARRWEGEWVSMQDLRKGPPPNNGLEVMYHAATLGERMLGHDEPIRVRQGERILFRLLNASATMDVTLALPGHRFTVIALDGNPVPSRLRSKC